MSDANAQQKRQRTDYDDTKEKDDLSAAQTQHLAWTSRQGTILTGGGVAEKLYTPERGFNFDTSNLPHHHLIAGTTHEAFQKFRSSNISLHCSLVTGCWDRTLFAGGWDHTSDKEELAYNIQTHNLFIDMRIPHTRKQFFPPGKFSSLDELNPVQLRLYARQHIFAGYTILEKEGDDDEGVGGGRRPVCTRHHCIDWNFVGTPRTRPNKWWIRMDGEQTKWKEYSYATDEFGQHYYFEQWERRGSPTDNSPRLAFRKASGNGRDGIIVVVGDHFNYVLERQLPEDVNDYDQKSLVDVVDAAVAAGDLDTARSYLSIQGGHGTISSQWTIDSAIPPWNEGTKLWNPNELMVVEGDSIDTCQLSWKGEKWDLFDSSFETVRELKSFFTK